MREHNHTLLAHFHMWEQPLSVSIFSVLPSCLVKRDTKAELSKMANALRVNPEKLIKIGAAVSKGHSSPGIYDQGHEESAPRVQHMMWNKQKTPWVIIDSESIVQVIKL